MTDTAGLIHSPLFKYIADYFEAGDTGADTTFLFALYVRAGVAGKLLEGVRNRVVIVTTRNPADLRAASSEASDAYPVDVF